MSTVHLLATLLAATLLTADGPRADEPLLRFEHTQAHMGTQFRIVLYAKDEAAAKRAADAAFARVTELNRIMSDYLATSELMQLCQKAGSGPTPVSKELFDVLARGQEVSRKSEGAFDVTVGPLVRLWRKVRYTGKLPGDEELARARGLVGYEKMRLDSKARTVQLLKPGMKLDLGGIAKGYAADEALKVLKRRGVDRALVAAGGDVAVSGPPPGQVGWKVAIAPLDLGRAPAHHVLLRDAAVSTSGDAEQHLEIGGKRYSHIVDPRTGLGLTVRLNVTVVAKEGATADSLTKTVSVLGPERGLKIVEGTEGVSALVVRKTPKGEEVFKSSRFRELRLDDKDK